MRYVGGKERIAKWVVENLLENKGGATRYVEPFVGGGAILTRMVDHFKTVEAGDSHEDLILLLQAVAAGWLPPESVTKEEYAVAKNLPSSPLRGAIGFGSSWGGKWWGGYIGEQWDKFHQCYQPSRSSTTHRALLKAAPQLAKATFFHRSYDEWDVGDGDLVYCDPPYANTLGFNGTGCFDSAKFWDTARKWVEMGAIVIVSEEQGPDDWEVLAGRTRKAFLKVSGTTENDTRNEKLFIKGKAE